MASFSPRDIVLGNTYRVLLSTGDDLTGAIENKNDSTMTLLTAQGKPYVFGYSLIKNCQLMAGGSAAVATAAPQSRP